MHRRIRKFTSYCYQFGSKKVLVLSLVQIRSKSKIWRKVLREFFVKHNINVGKWMKDLAIIRIYFYIDNKYHTISVTSGLRSWKIVLYSILLQQFL